MATICSHAVPLQKQPFPTRSATLFLMYFAKSHQQPKPWIHHMTFTWNRPVSPLNTIEISVLPMLVCSLPNLTATPRSDMSPSTSPSRRHSFPSQFLTRLTTLPLHNVPPRRIKKPLGRNIVATRTQPNTSSTKVFTLCHLPSTTLDPWDRLPTNYFSPQATTHTFSPQQFRPHGTIHILGKPTAEVSPIHQPLHYTNNSATPRPIFWVPPTNK